MKIDPLSLWSFSYSDNTYKGHNFASTFYVRTGLLQVPSNLDAIVIGGGVSGLSTAATLSKAGKRTSQSCIIFVLHRSKISFIEQDHKMIYLQIDLCS